MTKVNTNNQQNGLRITAAAFGFFGQIRTQLRSYARAAGYNGETLQKLVGNLLYELTEDNFLPVVTLGEDDNEVPSQVTTRKPKKVAKPKFKMSKKGRDAIARAQRKRWAEIKRKQREDQKVAFGRKLTKAAQKKISAQSSKKVPTAA
jgi:hypothetical protein